MNHCLCLNVSLVEFVNHMLICIPAVAQLKVEKATDPSGAEDPPSVKHKVLYESEAIHHGTSLFIYILGRTNTSKRKYIQEEDETAQWKKR